jgi:hypothetical protein
VNAAPGVRRRSWQAWVAGLVGAAGLAETFLLGSFGWFVAAFGIGSNCTDDFSCGSGSCAPCVTEHTWVTAGGIGQWALLVAAVTMLALGIRRPGWHRAAMVAAGALIPVAGAWFAISTIMAQRSF